MSNLESALLELNEHPEDSELVGKAFRALHTIKGSGAMFGFDELAAFTHNLEMPLTRFAMGGCQLPRSWSIFASGAGSDQGDAGCGGWSGRR